MSPSRNVDPPRNSSTSSVDNSTSSDDSLVRSFRNSNPEELRSNPNSLPQTRRRKRTLSNSSHSKSNKMRRLTKQQIQNAVMNLYIVFTITAEAVQGKTVVLYDIDTIKKKIGQKSAREVDRYIIHKFNSFGDYELNTIAVILDTLALKNGSSLPIKSASVSNQIIKKNMGGGRDLYDNYELYVYNLLLSFYEKMGEFYGKGKGVRIKTGGMPKTQLLSFVMCLFFGFANAFQYNQLNKIRTVCDTREPTYELKLNCTMSEIKKLELPDEEKEKGYEMMWQGPNGQVKPTFSKTMTDIMDKLRSIGLHNLMGMLVSIHESSFGKHNEASNLISTKIMTYTENALAVFVNELVTSPEFIPQYGTNMSWADAGGGVYTIMQYVISEPNIETTITKSITNAFKPNIKLIEQIFGKDAAKMETDTPTNFASYVDARTNILLGFLVNFSIPQRAVLLQSFSRLERTILNDIYSEKVLFLQNFAELQIRFIDKLKLIAARAEFGMLATNQGINAAKAIYSYSNEFIGLLVASGLAFVGQKISQKLNIT